MSRPERMPNNIIFKNPTFAYRPDFADRNGFGKSLTIALDPREAQELVEEGWPVRFDKEDVGPILKVNIAYPKDWPNLWPVVKKVQNGVMIDLGEDQLADLEQDTIMNISLEVRPQYYNVSGSEGITAKLAKMKVEVAPDIFCD